MSVNSSQGGRGLRIRSPQDFAAGLFMAGIGVFAFVLASDLPVGSLRQIGPGMLPKSFATFCAILGVMLSLSALYYDGQRLEGWSWRGVIFVLGGALAFGLTIRGFEISGWIGKIASLFLIAAITTALVSVFLPRENVLFGLVGKSFGLLAVFASVCVLAFLSFWSFIPAVNVSIPQLGLVVAGPLVILVAGLAADDLRWKELLIFALVMSTACALLFKYALGLPIPLAPWLLGI